MYKTVDRFRRSSMYLIFWQYTNTLAQRRDTLDLRQDNVFLKACVTFMLEAQCTF